MKKIAIPTREDMVDDHFGHCAYYKYRICHAGDGNHADAGWQYGHGSL